MCIQYFRDKKCEINCNINRQKEFFLSKNIQFMFEHTIKRIR